MLRISSGSVKNKKLESPNIEGYRAIQEVAKMAVFSILGEDIKDSEVLDLYAGSGNMGIEALSRGASFCTFVDENPESIKTIEKNLFTCGFMDNFELSRKDSLKFVLSTDKTFDVIFLDPFYKDLSHKHLLKNISRICRDNSKIFFFHAPEYMIEADLADTGLDIVSERKFGQSTVSQLTKRA